MSRSLRRSSALLVLLLYRLASASPDARPRFQARSFLNSSVQTTSSSTTTTSTTTTLITTTPTDSTTNTLITTTPTDSTTTTLITTTPTDSTTTTTTISSSTISNGTTEDPNADKELQFTTIFLDNNATIVGLPGATLTDPPNFDLDDLSALDYKLSNWIVAHSQYSIDWADVIGFRDDGSPVFGHPNATQSSRCPTFWAFPEPTIVPDPDGEPMPTITEIVTVMTTSPQFCETSTIEPPEYMGTRTDVEVPYMTSATKKVTATVYLEDPSLTIVNAPTDNSAEFPGENAEGKFTATLNAADMGVPPVTFQDHATPVVPNKPEATPVVPNKPEEANPVKPDFNNILANAITRAFANPAPSNNPAPQLNPPPNGNGSPGAISTKLGAIIASAFNGVIPNQNGSPPPPSPPQQGQVNGISYSVGPAAIVIDGKTYSPTAPTAVSLPNGQVANIGPGGLTIGNTFVPTNPDGSVSPSQGVINGVPYTLTPNGIVISGNTYSSSQPTSIPLPGGQTLVIGPGGSFQIGGVTVPGSSPGSSGVISGVPYTIQPGGIVISGTTFSTSQPTSVTLPNGQTLVIGPGGTVQIGGTNVPLVTSGSLNGISYSITPGGSIVINGQTLNPASATAITLPDGHIVTLGPSGLTIDGTPVPLTLGSGKTKGPLPMNPATTTTTTSGQTTTSRSGTASSTRSSTSTTSSRSATTTSPPKATTTAKPKKGVALGDRDLISLGTVLIVGLSSVLIALL
ncbi:MAG: hypothetical protein M1840_001660 [Geoglossum simile]|nr:MAG: hypothetical protein M1840_001660 [Geoglossum simile]